MEDNLSSAAELPYFEGDFWPNVLEESIKELDQEEEEKRRQAEAAEAAAAAAAATSVRFYLELFIYDNLCMYYLLRDINLKSSFLQCRKWKKYRQMGRRKV